MKVKTLPFHPTSENKRYVQLYETIKQEILQGHLKAGDQLPSIRTCAKQLALSRTTIEHAYQQLLLEGYIIAKAQTGYFVDVNEASANLRKEILREQPMKHNDDRIIDLRSSSIDAMGFDSTIWLHYLKDVLHDDERILSYGDPQGEWLLRRALQKYSYAMRGVLCKEDQIIVGASFQSLLYLVCSLFEGTRIVAMEIGGFPQGEQVFHDCGFTIQYLNHDDQGITISALQAHKVGMLYINSASCGTKKRALRSRRRTELLEYAREHDILILEDDHNGELRYQTKLRPAMQGFDQNDTLIYIRSFSKLLLPSIRMSFMVLNTACYHRYQAKKQNYNPSASKIEQLAFAHYLMDGHMEKQIRRLRKRYEAKSTKMIKAIQKELPMLDITLDESALLVWLKPDTDRPIIEYVKQAKAHGILVQHSSSDQLALSFAAITEAAIPDVIHRLSCIWNAAI